MDVNNPNSLNDNGVISFCEDKSGILWIGTHAGGLNRYDPENDKFSSFIHDANNPNSISNNEVNFVSETRSGELLIGTEGGGIDILNPERNKFIHYRHDPQNKNSLNDNDVNYILEDRFGILWIGTETGGLNKFDRKTNSWVHYKHDPENPNSISGNEIEHIFEDRSGQIWIGTDKNGLNKYDRARNQFIRYKNIPGKRNCISDNSIHYMFEDRAGNFWIGTEGAGINKLDRETETFTAYREENGLPNDRISGILEDDQGNLWISTGQGISKFNPQKETFKNFDKRDGLQGNEFNKGACYRTRDGKFYLGGSNGFNTFYPESVLDNPNIPPVYITDFKIFNYSVKIGEQSPLSKTIIETDEIVISYNQNNVSFEFAALHYSSSEKNVYAYILEGFDNDWNYSGERRTAYYTFLSPGEYIFRAKGSNNDGIWNEKGTSIKLIITPPFWATAWFRFLAAALIIGIVYLIYTMRIRYINTQRKYLERRVRERTEELRSLNKELQNEIAERIKATDALHETNRQLNQAQRLAITGKLSASIAHEINNPLHAINLHLDFIEKALPADFERNTNVHQLKNGLIRIGKTVKQLLDIQRPKAQTKNIFDLNEIAESTLEFLESQLKKNSVIVDKNFFERPVHIEASSQELLQVILNIILNAIDAMPGGGRINISTNIIDSNAFLSIKDSGVGIEEKDLDYIFKPFYTTKTQEFGSGLGLSIVKEIIESNDGKISVKSKIGKGTTFNCIFPLVKNEEH